MSARKLIVLLSSLFVLFLLVLLPQSTQAVGRGPIVTGSIPLNAPPPGEEIPAYNGQKPLFIEGRNEDDQGEHFVERSQYASTRRSAGDTVLSDDQVAAALAAASDQTGKARERALGVPANGYNGAWQALGPNPIVQVSRVNNLTHMSGRIGALAFRSDGRMLLGGATGGIWVYNTSTNVWEPKTDNIPGIAIGAIAVAPSNEDVVYAGTGEGETSGDSAAGQGVLKSLDGGMNWFKVSGAYFRGVSTANIAIDPTNADHLWIATIRGRGGSRRTTTPPNSQYGIWESTNGGLDWTLLKGTDSEFNGATDIRVDPQDPTKLYATFWGVGIFKSGDSGQHWRKIMNGLPGNADYAAGATRFAIAISHPPAQSAVLYAGFDYVDVHGVYHHAMVYKSTDEGANWTQLPGGTSPENVEGYCDGQCTYDNVIEVAPDDPNVVFAGGVFDYGIGLGGIYRSDDGGQTWLNLGYDQHPDFHQLAFNPADTQQVLVGSDGGVWYSADRGGRTGPSPAIDAVTWETLNGYVLGPVARTNLQIAQFTSIATVPTIPGRYWGGTQDNGTLRKSTSSQTWSDMYSGDGGQVLIDPTNASYVFGTYYGISPYRDDTGGAASFFTNQYIRNGINLNDRSDFYIPWVMNQDNPNQLFLGTDRLYRTNNSEADKAADVQWTPISGDLTSGCQGSAPNGARACVISAIAVSRGGGGVWVGTLDGVLHYAANGTTSDTPNYKLIKSSILPNRPIASIAVDNSDGRTAYIAYNGYNQATPTKKGHVFRTTNRGKTFTDISSNLPNVPANWITLDPSDPKTLYVATDTGPFVTHDTGNTWLPLGTGFPIVPVWQMDLDPLNRVLVAGTHGRGAFRQVDTGTEIPALVLSKQNPDIPVGPGQDVTFNLTVKNIGNATATGVVIKDQLPPDTTFVSATNGGTLVKGVVQWTGLSVPVGETISVGLTLHISPDVQGRVLNKKYSVKSDQGVGARGSPRLLALAPASKSMISPALLKGATKPAGSVDYTLTVRNLGYQSDTFKLRASGNTYPVEFRESTCTTKITETGTLAAGDTQDICVHVTNPNVKLKRAGGLASSDTATITVRPSSDPSAKDTATLVTYNITAPILLVDDDDNNPDVRSYYTAALNTYGQPYDVWDLATDSVLPKDMLNTHTSVVWFTGGKYPGPLLPYEADLTSFLNGGGRFFLSGQDVLDQAAGTTDFVHDYLHVDWDGTEAQNDKATDTVAGVGGNPVTGAIGTIALDHSVLNLPYEDRVTPISPAAAAFKDDGANTDGLSVDTSGYKVVFIAFPFEEYGNASDKATLMSDVLNWFTPTQNKNNSNNHAKGVKGGNGGKNNGAGSKN